jgi:hypothetical protein
MYPESTPQVAFSRPGHQRQAFVAGVEVKGNRETLCQDTFTLIPLRWAP